DFSQVRSEDLAIPSGGRAAHAHLPGLRIRVHGADHAVEEQRDHAPKAGDVVAEHAAQAARGKLRGAAHHDVQLAIHATLALLATEEIRVVDAHALVAGHRAFPRDAVAHLDGDDLIDRATAQAHVDTEHVAVPDDGAAALAAAHLPPRCASARACSTTRSASASPRASSSLAGMPSFRKLEKSRLRDWNH